MQLPGFCKVKIKWRQSCCSRGSYSKLWKIWVHAGVRLRVLLSSQQPHKSDRIKEATRVENVMNIVFWLWHWIRDPAGASDFHSSHHFVNTYFPVLNHLLLEIPREVSLSFTEPWWYTTYDKSCERDKYWSYGAITRNKHFQNLNTKEK